MCRLALLLSLPWMLASPFAAAGDLADDAGAPRLEVHEVLDPVPLARGPGGLVGPVSLVGDGAAFAGLEVSMLPLNVDPEGDMPREVAFLPDGSAALVVNRDTDTVVVFDVATQAITDTVGVGDFPVDVAVSPDGSLAVVPNVLDDTVSILDLATRTVAATVRVTGSQPFAVEITPDGTTAVVAVINDGVASAFSVVDLVTMAESHTIPTAPQGVIGFFFGPESGIFGNLFTRFALAGGTRVVLPDRSGGRVLVYDVGSGAELASLPTASGAVSVDVHPDGTVAVVGHESGGVNLVAEIDLVGLSVTGSFTVPNALTAQVIRITPDKAFAIAAISNNVIFVDLTSGAVTSTVSTGTVGDIELSFDGQYAFVSNFNSRVIDVSTQSQVASLSLAPTAEAAASPVEHRVVGLNNRFREDIHLYDTNGASSFVEGFVLSGEPPEADAPRTVAMTGDGLTALVANNTSRTASIVDLATGTVRATVDTGDRCLGVAVAADGVHGVVCNGDEDTVTVVDLPSGTVAAQLAVNTRPAEVAVSPDGTRAYVTSVAGTDRVHFVDLDGASSSVTGSIVSGQMGSALGYTYTASSGITASPVDDVVGVCISFDDELLLIDGATQSEITRVPTGDFPIRVLFTPDGSTAYVANAFGDSVTVVDVDGASSSVTGTLGGIEFPLVMLSDEDGDFVYVGDTDGGSPRLHVVDTASQSVVGTVPLPSPARAGHVSSIDGRLIVSTTASELVTVDAAGPASAVLDIVDLSGGASDMAFSETLQTAIACQPGPDDAVDLVDANLALWELLGGALAGTSGEPVLVGAGPLEAGTTATLTLANARPSATCGLIVGASLGDVPFKGGTLVPAPDVVLVGFVTGADGSLLLEATWPAGVPSGTDVVSQAWIVDPAGPVGFAASNAAAGTTP